MGSPGLLLRAVRELVRQVDRTGAPRRVVKLDVDSMLKTAERRTHLTDFGGDEFREPLRRLLASIEDEARLNLIGRIAAREDLARMLANRLTLRRDRTRYPDIAAEQIRRPIFITGLPRSGSTLLHNLLAQDPHNRIPLNWETLHPSPPPQSATHGTDPRIATAEREIRWFARLAPAFRAVHMVGASLPEECVVILSHEFLSYQFSSTWFVPTYHAWMENQDLRPAYRLHHDFLQHLQWRCGGARWVLKAPPHWPALGALLDVYPDARIIFTHRDPLEVVASVTSLHVILRSTFSDDVDPHAVGPEVATMLADDLARGMAARAAAHAAESQFLDVFYADLLRDPIETVRRIYTHYDLPLDALTEARMRRYIVFHPQHREGVHTYSLGGFGLDPDRETERFHFYTEDFGRRGLMRAEALAALAPA